jgi:hypothetical protein
MKIPLAFIALVVYAPTFAETLIVGTFSFAIGNFPNTEIIRHESVKGSSLAAVLRTPSTTTTPYDETIIIEALEVLSGGLTGSLEVALSEMSRGAGHAVGSESSSIPKKITLDKGLAYRSTFCDVEKLKGRCATVLFFPDSKFPIRRYLFIVIFTNSVYPPTDDEVVQKIIAIDFQPPNF